MMLKYAFGLHEEATAVEKAVEKVLDAKDIGGLEVRTRYVTLLSPAVYAFSQVEIDI